MWGRHKKWRFVCVCGQTAAAVGKGAPGLKRRKPAPGFELFVADCHVFAYIHTFIYCVFYPDPAGAKLVFVSDSKLSNK